MTRFAWSVALVAVLAACGGDGGKPGCDAPGSCGAGSYCAHTPDGNVCWPDSVPPVVADVHATCSDTPCLRTSTLHVAATVTDDAAVGGATVTLDLDAAHPRAMQHGTGDAWTADVPLAELPFPYFEHAVIASVTGRDEAGNTVGPLAAAESPGVTRLAWTRTLKGASAAALSSPAMLTDGRIVVAGSDGRLYFVAANGQSSQGVTLSGSALSGPAAVASDAIWVGGQDGTLYSVSSSGAAGRSCAAGAPLVGAPAVLGSRVVGSANALSVVVVDSTSLCAPADVLATAQPAVGSNGHIYVPAAGVLRSFSLQANGALHDEWTTSPAPAIGVVSAPPSVDDQGQIWTTAVNGSMYRTTSAGSAQSVTPTPALSANSTGAIVLSDNSVVLGDQAAAQVRRIGSTPTAGWTSLALSGSPSIPLALGGTTPALLASTSRGYLYLLNESDGTIIWSGRLTASNQSLETPNIWTAPGAATSTAYLAGADGNLYAVIVDGALDTSAPWPKAYHDPQNTSNAGYAP